MVEARIVKNLNKQNIPLLTFVFIIFAGFGVWFLSANQIASASIYFTMFMFFIGILVLLQFYLKDDDEFSLVTKDFKFPFVNSLSVDVGFYVLLTVFAILVAIIPVGQGFTVSDLSVPLTASGNLGSQVLSAVSLEQSTPNKIFITGVLAGIFETLLYNFILVFAGAVIANFIYSLLTDNKKLGFIPKRVFIIGFALLFSVFGFMGSHYLNDSYTGIMFLKAGVFLLVTNIMIYVLRIPLSGIIGYHIMNNIIWLIKVFGAGTIFKGFISIFGLIYIPLNLLIIWYFFRKIGKKNSFGEDVKELWSR